MSRLAPCGLLLALGVALCVPGPARGQQTEQELMRHLDSLMPAFEEAKVAAEAARAARRREMEAKQPTDSLQVGLVRVLVPPGRGDVAVDVIGTVWERSFAALVDRSPSLRQNQIFFQWAVNLEPYKAPSLSIRPVSGGRWRSRAYMEDRAEQVISEFLKADLWATPFQEAWDVSSIRPPRRPEDLYRQLVVAPSIAVRSCLEGDDHMCLVGLGLVDDGYGIDEWYSPEERRLLVMRHATRFRRQAEDAQACLAGSYDACDVALHLYSDQHHDARWASPVLPEIRSTMLWYALEQGGAGAWGRLLDHADDTPLEALEAVSGMDGEALAAGWRTWFMEGRPASHAGLGSLTLGALFWTLLLITFAARSTRWRLG